MSKIDLSFDNIFKSSFEFLKKNIREVSVFGVILFLIYFLSIILGGKESMEIMNQAFNFTAERMPISNSYIIISIVSYIAALFIVSAFVVYADNKNKNSLAETFKKTLRRYLLLVFTIILFIVLIGCIFGVPFAFLTILGAAVSSLANTSFLLIMAPIILFIGLLIGITVLGTYWAFFMFPVLLRNVSFFKAFKYSSNIVKGRWWKVFGYHFLIFILLSLTTTPLSFIIPKLSGSSLFGFTLGMGIVTIVQVVAMLVMYTFLLIFFERLEKTVKVKKVESKK